MANIRSAERGSKEYWITRIGGYMRCEHHPQKGLHLRIVYVAVEDEKVVAFVAGHLTRRFDCDGELEWINVIPEHRGSGTAFSLLGLLANWFVRQNAFRICVDVDPSNTAARKFYMKHGAEELNKYWLVWKDISIIRHK